MSEQELILMQEAGVKKYDSESPPTVGLKAGAFADVGSLILTSRRLIYVAKGGASRATAWVLGGALAARAIEKSVSKAEIDDLLKYEGSYAIPLQEITHVEAKRKMGSAYLRVDNSSYGQKPAHAYIFGSGWSKNEDWVNAINSAITVARSSQAAPTASQGQTQQANLGQIICPSCRAPLNSSATSCPRCGVTLWAAAPTNAPPPPPPTATCPSCGGQLTYIPQYQRWYCYKEKKYV